jgi:hypothetical protein
MCFARVAMSPGDSLRNTRVSRDRSLWRRLRAPISGLGTGPRAWALAHFPSAMHSLSAAWRVRLVKNHLPAEGARGLREQVENRMPIHRGTKGPARHRAGWRFGCSRKTTAMSASSLSITSSQAPAMISIVERLDFLHPALRGDIQRLERAPRLNATFETSVPGLRFIGPVSAKSFSPLFRFVAGSEFASWIVSAQLASQVSS